MCDFYIVIKDNTTLFMKNLRNILVLGMLAVILLPILESCKKGPEDPFFSIFSRKNRITETWQANSFFVNKVDFLVRSDTMTAIDTFCPDDWTFVNPGIPIPSAQWFFQTDTDLTFLLEFAKDGDYNLFTAKNVFYSRTISLQLDTAKKCRNFNRKPLPQFGDTTFTIGEWNFGGAVGDKKTKEQVILTDFADFTSVVWDITLLKKNQMKLERRYVDTTGGQNRIFNIEAEFAPVGEDGLSDNLRN